MSTALTVAPIVGAVVGVLHALIRRDPEDAFGLAVAYACVAYFGLLFLVIGAAWLVALVGA